MTYRLQKTLIHKYLKLVDLDFANETQIRELINSISNLYGNSKLSERDIYRQKIELILNNLNKDFKIVQRKRVNKELKLTISKDLYQTLKSDLENIDFGKTNLDDLKNLSENEEFEISKDNVIKALENIVIPKRKLTSEAELEKYLSEQLSKTFGKEKVHRQYSIGGFLALKTDIDIGNGQVGIELKIIDKLSATDMQRLIGQAVYYTKRYYNSNLIVFAVSKQEMTATSKELKEFIEEFGVSVIHNQAITL